MTGRRGFLAGTVSALWRLLGRIAALLSGRGRAAGAWDGQAEDLPPAHWLAAIRAAAPDKLDGTRLIADFEGRAPDPSAEECRAETGTGFVPPWSSARPVGVEKTAAASRAATETLRAVSPRPLATPLAIVAPKTIAPEIVEPVVAGPGPVVPSPVGRRGGLRPRVAVLSPVSRAAEAAGSQSVEQSPGQRPERNGGSGISRPRRIPAVRILSGWGLAAARSGAAEREAASAGPGEAPGEGGAQGWEGPPASRAVGLSGCSGAPAGRCGPASGPRDCTAGAGGRGGIRRGRSGVGPPPGRRPGPRFRHRAPGGLAAPGRGSVPQPAPTGAGLRIVADAAGRFPAMDPAREAEPLPSFERRLDGPEARRARFAREQGGELWTV